MIRFWKGITSFERVMVVMCVTGIVGTALFWCALAYALVNAI